MQMLEIKGVGDAGSTAEFRMLWSAMVCLGLLQSALDAAAGLAAAGLAPLQSHINKSLKCLESYREKCLGQREIRDNQANATKQRILRQSRLL